MLLLTTVLCQGQQASACLGTRGGWRPELACARVNNSKRPLHLASTCLPRCLPPEPPPTFPPTKHSACLVWLPPGAPNACLWAAVGVAVIRPACH